MGFLPSFTVSAVLSNNIRSLLLAGLLAVFSFGSLAIVLLMTPMGIIGFFMYQVAHWGLNPGLFLAAFVLPHGIFELPAAILATAAALAAGRVALIVRAPAHDGGRRLAGCAGRFYQSVHFRHPALAVGCGDCRSESYIAHCAVGFCALRSAGRIVPPTIPPVEQSLW